MTVEPSPTNAAARADDLLHPLRQELDAIDNQILELFLKRQTLRRKFAEIKHQNDIPVAVPKRMAEVLQRVMHKAHQMGLDPHFARELYELVIRYSHRFERSLRAEKDTVNDG